MHLKHAFWALAFAAPLLLAGCETVDSVGSWLGDEDEQAAAEGETRQKYVTLTVKDRYGFRIEDPMGKRTTGGNCAVWKDQEEDAKGACCWNARGECACPCPD